ncbi:MAG: hypothetical protein V4487_02255 [Chlamydiota bacterium]
MSIHNIFSPTESKDSFANSISPQLRSIDENIERVRRNRERNFSMLVGVAGALTTTIAGMAAVGIPSRLLATSAGTAAMMCGLGTEQLGMVLSLLLGGTVGLAIDGPEGAVLAISAIATSIFAMQEGNRANSLLSIGSVIALTTRDGIASAIGAGAAVVAGAAFGIVAPNIAHTALHNLAEKIGTIPTLSLVAAAVSGASIPYISGWWS